MMISELQQEEFHLKHIWKKQNNNNTYNNTNWKAFRSEVNVVKLHIKDPVMINQASACPSESVPRQIVRQSSCIFAFSTLNLFVHSPSSILSVRDVTHVTTRYVRYVRYFEIVTHTSGALLMRCRRLLLPTLSSRRPSWAPIPGAFTALTSAAELEVPWLEVLRGRQCCGTSPSGSVFCTWQLVFCQVQEGESGNTRPSFDLWDWFELWQSSWKLNPREVQTKQALYSI